MASGWSQKADKDDRNLFICITKKSLSIHHFYVCLNKAYIISVVSTSVFSIQTQQHIFLVINCFLSHLELH